MRHKVTKKQNRTKKRAAPRSSTRTPVRASRQKRQSLSRAVYKSDSIRSETVRSRAGTLLGRSEDLFRTFFDHATNLVFIKGRDGRYLYVNSRFEQAFRLEPGSVLGKTDVELFPRQQAEQFQVNDRQVLESGETREFEETAWYDDGLHTGIVVKFPLRNESGRIYAIGGIVTDITGRKRVEEALREKDHLARSFLENSATAAWMKDAEGRYVYISPNFERRFGVRLGDYKGKTDRELWPSDVAEAFRANDLVVLRENRVVEIVEEARASDGSRSWWLSHKFPFQDSAGKRYVGGIGVEITERKHAEEALREKDDLTKSFLNNSAIIAWIKDAEGRHVYLSPNYERRFNIQQNDWLGKTDFEVWPTDIAEKLRQNDLTVLKENRRLEVIEQTRNGDGSPSWWLNSKFPYQNAGGQTFVGGLGVDITDRIHAEERLHEHQKELQRQRAELQYLASKLMTAQEQERQRIARELHDDVSQRLAALVLDVASLEHQPPVLPELIPKFLEPIREQLEQLSDDIHNLAYTLHPSLLKHAGLEPAIEDHIRKLTQRTGLRILLKARSLPRSLSLEESIALFRVVQESLQNIVRHANATEAVVKLSGSPRGVGASVTDNGRGFDVNDKMAHQKGLGLMSMHERMRFLNGFLRVHSRPADGTKVCAWIPFKGDKS